ncbi:MAG: anti-sigma factor [Betaproteobacteria bacterium]
MSRHDERGDAALNASIRSGATRHTAPPALRADVLRAVRHAHPGRSPQHKAWQQWFGLGAAFAAGILVSWLAGVLQPAPDAGERIESQVIAAHVRSLMPGHVADIASSDQHTVKPWLSTRLDFSPPVNDLRAEGFALTGGRLDYVNERPVAALVYLRNGHVINVFVWPEVNRGGATRKPASSHNGFNVATWDQRGMRFWAVSDLAAVELNGFAERLQQQDGAGT